MPFIQWDQVVQGLSPDRTVHSLANRIGLWAPIRCLQYAHTQADYRLIQLLGEDSISVVNEKTIAVVRWNGFSQLLERPLSRRVLSDIDMNDAPRTMLYHNQHVQQSKCSRYGHKEITGDDDLSVVPHKR